tara:strand:+ start:7362 stop:8273 length:912 start_codon:yes stop_codon:yes gene_type:complete
LLRQRTILRKVGFEGIGLHSGKLIRTEICPAESDKGIIFRRIDIVPHRDISLNNCKVTGTQLASTISENNIEISTVEHLVAALSGLGIDNVLVKVSGTEIPILDGSAAIFVHLLKSAGCREQNSAKKFITINRPVRVSDGEKWAMLEPYFGFKLNFVVDFTHPIINKNNRMVDVDFERMSFVKDIARARTFGFLNDVGNLLKNNLARGGGLDNAVVLSKTGILNPEGLRSENELAMHKALDAIGDLYLIGYPMLGSYSAFKSGHALNNKLIKKLVREDNTWSFSSFENLREAPLAWAKQWSWI